MLGLVTRAANLIGRNSTVARVLRPLYRRTLTILYAEGGMPWQINGTPLRIDPTMREEMGQVYDASVVAWLRPRVKPGQVVWNVGANVGVYALQLAHWVGPSGRVVAVEPNPVARASLERHIAWNGLADRVTVVASAIGDKEGTTTMWVDGASPMSAVGRANPVLAGSAHPITVSITTLDAMVDDGQPRPDWIVMDIEGFELFALRGGERLLSAPSAPGIVLELHPDIWPRIGSDRATLDDWLLLHRRRVTPLRGEGDVHDVHGIVALEPIT